MQKGLALCKLHHAAFDGQFVGIRVNLVVCVRRDVLKEADGPIKAVCLPSVRVWQTRFWRRYLPGWAMRSRLLRR